MSRSKIFEEELGSTSGVSRSTLEETPARALTFLRGVGISAPIRGALMARGYTKAEHAAGWTHLHKVSGFDDVTPTATDDDSVARAIKELDDWDEDGFRIVRAALKHRHPDQAAFVLEGLAPSTGPASVLGVKKLLDRLDALESSEARKATRKADQAALKTLAERGIDKAHRDLLAKLVQVAQSAPELADVTPQSETARDRAYVNALIELRGWYEEWSEIARAVIKRRDHLIQLGLAKKKKKAKKGDSVEPIASTTPAGPTP